MFMLIKSNGCVVTSKIVKESLFLFILIMIEVVELLQLNLLY